MPVEGPWADQCTGLDGVRVDIAMMRTPDGHSRLELTKFRAPAEISAEPAAAPANTLGLRRIMFAVDDIDDVIARLRTHGAELVGEVARYEDLYRLCYLRGPAGIIVALHSARIQPPTGPPVLRGIFLGAGDPAGGILLLDRGLAFCSVDQCHASGQGASPVSYRH